MAAKDPEEDIVLLLSNKDFKDWVLDPSGDRDVYWTNWMKSNPDKLHAVNKAREIVRQLKFKEDLLSDQEVELMLGNIISQDVSARAGKVIHLKREGYLRWAKIAASFLLVLSFVYAYHYFSSASDSDVAFKTITNLKGQRTRIKLPDESIVYLNASSTLTFPEVFSDSERTVELTGEAFFEIVKDPAKRFVVKTNTIKTVVLGTSFNVRSFEADSLIDISLVTGKVRVVREHPQPGNQDLALLPGEQLTYHKGDGSFEKSNFKILDATGWKDGVLVFNNTDFAGFIEKLEQWYGVEIDVTSQPSEKWQVNGHFDNESLKEVLVGIQFVYDIDYEINDNRVTLKCN
jgi:transmembrane sensor